MGIISARGAAFGLGVCALFACGGSLQYDSGGQRTDQVTTQSEARASQRPTLTRAIGGGPRDPDQRFRATVSKIASARCDREMRCGRVGPNEAYPTRDDCVSKSEADKRGDIDANECMLGVSQTGLVECLNAIRDEDCNNPLDAVAKLKACRTANLCLR
jgi:hypothetical protein